MGKRSRSTSCRNCTVKIKRTTLQLQKANTVEKPQTNCTNSEIIYQSEKDRTLEEPQFEPEQSSTLVISNSDENIKSKKNIQTLCGDTHSTVRCFGSTLEKEALNLIKHKENKKPKKLTVKSIKRKRVSVNSGVYEFPSQVSVDSENVDPAGDIIKKLIKNGKVKVARNYKRKIRLNMPYSKGKCSDKTKSPYLETNLSQNYETIKQCTSTVLTNVLNKQTNPSDLQNKRAKQLLHMVRKIVSTPTQKNTSRNNFMDSSLSPIAAPPTLNSNNINKKVLKAQSYTLESPEISEVNNLHSHSFKQVITNVENLTLSNARHSTTTALSSVQSSKTSQIPSKTVNILEVVHLPPWSEETVIEENLRKDGKNATIAQKSPPPCTERCPNLKSSDKSTLFGFEEYLTNSILNGSSKNHKIYKVSQKDEKSLHEKLKELSKWQPKIINKDSLITKVAYANKRPNNLENNKTIKTKNVNEILCSTMVIQKINKETCPNKLDELECSNVKINHRYSNYLFSDPTLKKKIKPQKRFKTYDKPKSHNCFKGGRNNFMNIIKEGFENANNTLQMRNANEIARKEKHSEHQENRELEEFAINFNKACEEVEQYPLIIEKSEM